MLKPIGQAIPVGANGTLPRIGKPPVEPWAELTNALADNIRNDLADNFESVILRGSLPRRTAVSGISDIDLVVFTKTPNPNYFPSTPPAGADLDLSVMTKDELLNADICAWMRFALAFSGWTISGQDLIPQLPDPTLGDHAVAHLRDRKSWEKKWEHMFIAARDDTERKEISQWLMKRIIRSLFESVMFETQTYTRDIYPCATAAVLAYPHAETQIWLAAELAIAPSTSLQENQTVAQPLLELLRQIDA